MSSDVGEDYFGEDSDADDKAADAQIKKLTENRTKDGIRDGITDGQNVTLQSGFNVGYQKAFSVIEPLAAIRGCLWSLLESTDSCVTTDSGVSVHTKVEGIITRLQELEKNTKELLHAHCASPGSDPRTEFVNQNLQDCASNLHEECRITLIKLVAPQDYLSLLFDKYVKGCR